MPLDATTLADAIIGVVEDLDVTFVVDDVEHTVTLAGYRWSQKDISSLPCAIVQLPGIERTGVDETESELGRRDVIVEFPVAFCFELDDIGFAQEQALAAVEAFIDAVDNTSPPLGDNNVVDVKVTSAGPPELDRDQARPVLVYPTTLELLKLVS